MAEFNNIAEIDLDLGNDFFDNLFHHQSGSLFLTGRAVDGPAEGRMRVIAFDAPEGLNLNGKGLKEFREFANTGLTDLLADPDIPKIDLTLAEAVDPKKFALDFADRLERGFDVHDAAGRAHLSAKYSWGETAANSSLDPNVAIRKAMLEEAAETGAAWRQDQADKWGKAPEDFVKKVPELQASEIDRLMHHSPELIAEAIKTQRGGATVFTAEDIPTIDQAMEGLDVKIEAPPNLRAAAEAAAEVAEDAGKVFRKMGPVAGGVAILVLSGAAGADELYKGGDLKAAARTAGEVAYASANPYAETTKAIIDGDVEAAERLAITETAANAGGWGGAAAGAAIGFATPIPGGALIGGIIGGVAGAEGLEWAADKLYNYFNNEEATADQVFTAEEVKALEQAASQRLVNVGLVGEVSVGGQMMDMALALEDPAARKVLRNHFAESDNQEALDAVEMCMVVGDIKAECAAANPEALAQNEVAENEPVSLHNNPVMGMRV